MELGNRRREVEGVSYVLAPSEGLSKLIPIHEESLTRSCIRSVLEKQSVRRPNRLIRVRRLLALDFLGGFLPHVMLLAIEMPLVGPPSIGVLLRDAKGLQEFLPLQKDVVLPPPEHIR